MSAVFRFLLWRECPVFRSSRFRSSRSGMCWPTYVLPGFGPMGLSQIVLRYGDVDVVRVFIQDDRRDFARAIAIDHELGEVVIPQYDVDPLATQLAQRRPERANRALPIAGTLRINTFGLWSGNGNSWRREPGSRAAAMTSISSSANFRTSIRNSSIIISGSYVNSTQWRATVFSCGYP